MKLIITFFILSVINVIFSTVRTLVTVKSGKGMASIINAGYFAFYNVVMIYTMADFPLPVKCGITFVCNLVGVYIVKWAEEKSRKDKMWKVEITASPSTASALNKELEERGIPHNYINVNKYIIFNLYCATQKESAFARELCDKYKVKYFVSETKAL